MGKVVLTGSGLWQPPEGLTEIEQVLIVGGGGGGGSNQSEGWPSGGGGGGGVLFLENVEISPETSISFSVGNGGSGAAAGAYTNGSDGADTTFGDYAAYGGKGGKANNGDSNRQGGDSGGHSESGTGFTGGNSNPTNPGWPGGGGASATENGGNATTSTGGAGGQGYLFDGERYGSGGGGGTYLDPGFTFAGVGGDNAGDGGGLTGAIDGESAIDGFGGGGGGAGGASSAASGGDGGAGTIILIGEGVEEGGEVPFDDWAENIDPITDRTYYALELDDGVLDPVRIPISSWQATVQSGRSSYAQAVIPSALQWVDAVNDRADGEFIIYRGVRYANGETQESEMARSPLQQINFDQGPTRATLRVSGYRTEPPPASALTRTLRNVRSRSVSAAGLRVRCDIDFFLRPGHTAVALGDEFTAAYINYYANAQDEYMDVGERAD